MAPQTEGFANAKRPMRFAKEVLNPQGCIIGCYHVRTVFSVLILSQPCCFPGFPTCRKRWVDLEFARIRVRVPFFAPPKCLESLNAIPICEMLMELASVPDTTDYDDLHFIDLQAPADMFVARGSRMICCTGTHGFQNEHPNFTQGNLRLVAYSLYWTPQIQFNNSRHSIGSCLSFRAIIASTHACGKGVFLETLLVFIVVLRFCAELWVVSLVQGTL